MATIKKYETDVCKCEDHAVVASLLYSEEQCAERSVPHIPGTVLVELDGTIFYPEGGGQPCDLGTIAGIPIVDVFLAKGAEVIYHRLQVAADTELPTVGSDVFCKLDWDRRLSHMQLHSAEHLLSGRILRNWRGVNKGFHMGSDYATLDILFPPDGDIKEFSQEMLDQLELDANQIVWENIEVATHFCTSAEQAASHPLRKPLAIDEGITVVCIGGGDELYDCCACCGTHVPTTGSIGLIQLLKTENYKGMIRMTFTAGLPAFHNTSLRQRITDALCVRYSADIGSLMERINVQEQKNGAVRKELYDLKKDLLREEAECLLSEWLQGADDGKPLASIGVYRYTRYSADDLQALGHAVEESLPGPVALVSEREHTAILLSPGTPHAGNLVRDYANMYKGRGGGKAKLARAIFERAEDLEMFLDLIEKHLRA